MEKLLMLLRMLPLSYKHHVLLVICTFMLSSSCSEEGVPDDITPPTGQNPDPDAGNDDSDDEEEPEEVVIPESLYEEFEKMVVEAAHNEFSYIKPETHLIEFYIQRNGEIIVSGYDYHQPMDHVVELDGAYYTLHLFRLDISEDEDEPAEEMLWVVTSDISVEKEYLNWRIDEVPSLAFLIKRSDINDDFTLDKALRMGPLSDEEREVTGLVDEMFINFVAAGEDGTGNSWQVAGGAVNMDED